MMANNNQMVNDINRITVSEIRLSYYPKMKNIDRAMINKSQQAYPIFLSNWNLETIYLQESAYMLMLNCAGRVLGIVQLSMGGVTGTVIDPRLVFRYALLSGATAIMLAHNHPSGNLTPSSYDIAMTAKIKAAGSFHDIKLIDHLIVMPDGYLSMADEGLL
jgi:DNA repair protein RadC